MPRLRGHAPCLRWARKIHVMACETKKNIMFEAERSRTMPPDWDYKTGGAKAGLGMHQSLFSTYAKLACPAVEERSRTMPPDNEAAMLAQFVPFVNGGWS